MRSFGALRLSITLSFAIVPITAFLSSNFIRQKVSYGLLSTNNNDDSPNPYADPNYPDLEFVNYDHPEHPTNNDDMELEEMRQDRKRRNDEFQFETYHAQILRGGEVTMGEWTVFQTDTFLGTTNAVPQLIQWDRVLKVVSCGKKVVVNPMAEWRVDGERIIHEERLANRDDFPAESVEGLEWQEEERRHVRQTFWPKNMESWDFRGSGGNMCVGKAYTICDAVPLQRSGPQQQTLEQHDKHEGPFREMRTELGLQDNGMRFRIKLDYALLKEPNEEDESVPPLHLRTFTVCRETLDGYWPNPSDNGDVDPLTLNLPTQVSLESTARTKRNQDKITNALFGPPGAPGGLYDPPPVGSQERAIHNYMLVDLEGGATALLPHRLDQHSHSRGVENMEEQFGWVTSLDWTPGKIRYQVDRKVLATTKLKGLKTLELSEVIGEEAERWRPKDGGRDMRQ